MLDNLNHIVLHAEIKLISKNIFDNVDRYEAIKILRNMAEHRRVFEFSKTRVIPVSKHVEDEKGGEGRERERDRCRHPEISENQRSMQENHPLEISGTDNGRIFQMRLKLA